jgi:hypothetical protein
MILLAVAAVVLCAGCELLDVEMTSTPDMVRRGQPVTFDLKVTNRSECPVFLEVLLVPFLTKTELETEFFGDLPPNPPQEVLDFIDELRMFVDELCSGGEPELPEPPMFPASCSRSGDVIDCEMSGAVLPGGSGSMTFVTLGNRLRCEVDGGVMTCHLRLPFRSMSATAGAVTEAANKPLSCFTAAELGIDADEADVFCFVGTPPPFEALGPGEMATGQVTLPARGEGVVRNFAIGVTNDPEDLGVCKGGSDAGEPCSLLLNDDPGTEQCPAGTCGEGICDGGDDDGEGCDEATEMADCQNGGTCNLCAEPLSNSFLPLDCTETTVIGLEPAPVMSRRGLLAMAAILLFVGSLWLQRRARRRGKDLSAQSIGVG